MSVHFFYLIALYFTYTRSLHALGYFYYPEPKITQPIISWIPQEFFPTLIPIVIGLYLVITLILALYPWIRLLRIFHLFLHLLFFAYLSSFGHDATDYYVITFILPLLLFLKGPKDREHNGMILTMAQLGSVMSYAMAGLWKIRAVFDHGVDQLMANLGNVIAFEHFQRGHELLPLSEFFIENDWVTGPMFVVTILVQTFSPLGALSRWPIQVMTALILCVFHILSEVIVHINFRPQMMVVILFLIYLPSVRAKESR